MKLLMENWRRFLTEEEEGPLDPKDITTIGQLQTYFKSLEPSKLKKVIAKYGSAATKLTGYVMGGVAGAYAGPAGFSAGVGAGFVAQEAIEALLVTAVIAFANIEDGTYPENSAISYFDLDDRVVNFLRDIESKGKNLNKISQPEKETLDLMIKYIKMKAKKAKASDTIGSVLNLKAAMVMDKKFAKYQKIKLSPAD